MSTLDYSPTQISVENSSPLQPTVFMARVAIVAIVIAGFFVTGDISFVLMGGRRAVRTVAGWPHQITGWFAPGNEAPAAPAASPAPVAPPASPPATQRPAAPSIPAAATRSARISELSPGDRLLVWCGGDGPTSMPELVAIDLIDPAKGEALLSRQLDPRTKLPELETAAGQTPTRVVLEAAVIEQAETVSFRLVAAGPAVRPAGFGQPLFERPHIGPVRAVLAVRRP